VVGRVGGVAEKSDDLGVAVGLGEGLGQDEALELGAQLQGVAREARRERQGEKSDGTLAHGGQVAGRTVGRGRDREGSGEGAHKEGVELGAAEEVGRHEGAGLEERGEAERERHGGGGHGGQEVRQVGVDGARVGLELERGQQVARQELRQVLQQRMARQDLVTRRTRPGTPVSGPSCVCDDVSEARTRCGA
jgi:hypothetical protein